MTSFDTLKTADYSPLVVHFTKDREMVRRDLIIDGDPLFAYRDATAKDRLRSILGDRIIHASPMPFLPTQQKAVCFTECVWGGLTRLADTYSPYGIVFSKRLIFDGGGGPALYCRGDLLKETGESIPGQLHSFIAPFDPEATLKPSVPLDWLHEREWRLPQSLNFTYADIEYVLVNTIDDARALVREIGARNLPEDKLITFDVYKNIKHGWGDR